MTPDQAVQLIYEIHHLRHALIGICFSLTAIVFALMRDKL